MELRDRTLAAPTSICLAAALAFSACDAGPQRFTPSVTPHEGLQASAPEAPVPSTSTGETLRSSVLFLDDLNLFTAAIDYAMGTFLKQLPTGATASTAGFDCDGAGLPSDDPWKGFCWLEVSGVPLGLLGLDGFAPASFGGRIGYRTDQARGLQVQLDLVEEDAAAAPQKLYLNFWVDVFDITADWGTGKTLLTLRSPPRIYSFKTQRADPLYLRLCAAFKSAAQTVDQLGFSHGAEALLAPVAMVCQAVELAQTIADQFGPPALTTFAYIQNLALFGEHYRGSMVLGKSISDADFRNAAAFAVVHWGYPDEESPSAFAPPTRFLVKFKGGYKGIDMTLPADQNECYVVDLLSPDTKQVIELLSGWAAGESGAWPDLSGIALPVEKCPLSCIADAECSGGEVCDPATSSCAPGCFSDGDCSFLQPTCCLTPTCQEKSGVAGAGICKLLTSVGVCSTDAECPDGQWCSATLGGTCIPGCRSGGDCPSSNDCCKGIFLHYCLPFCL